MEFEVRPSAPAERAVAVRYATANGTARAGSDCRRAAGIVRPAAGEMVKTVSVRVRGNRESGAGEFFKLKLARPTGVTLDDAEGLGTLVRP
jgi:endoglucanase